MCCKRLENFDYRILFLICVLVDTPGLWISCRLKNPMINLIIVVGTFKMAFETFFFFYFDFVVDTNLVDRAKYVKPIKIA